MYIVKHYNDNYTGTHCPPGMIYQQCGPLCPKTCRSYGSTTCYSGCVAGCFCPNDKLLSDGECVEPSDCPGIHGLHQLSKMFVQSKKMY